MENGIPETGEVTTNETVTHQSSSLEPKTSKTNNTSHRVVSSSMSELANDSSRLHALNCNDGSSTDMIDTSIVNIFATNNVSGSKTLKIRSDSTTLPFTCVELGPDIVFKGYLEDLDTNVS